MLDIFALFKTRNYAFFMDLGDKYTVTKVQLLKINELQMLEVKIN